jgi:hypothetical protein
VARSSLLAAAGVLIVLGGGAAAALSWNRNVPVAESVIPPTVTVAVDRTNLTDDRMYPGTLGFGAGQQVTGTGSGVVTRLPTLGAKVARGSVLYRVDDQPVVVFFGTTPIFRIIDKPGIVGNDVLVLRRNLAELGYAVRSRTPETSDTGLLGALKRWQTELGVTAPGALHPGRVAVLSGGGRVSEVTAVLGGTVAGPILRVTDTKRLIIVPMTATDSRSVRIGSTVRVTLPDAREINAKVTAIGRTVQGSDPGSGEPAKLTVTISPAKPADVANLDEAPVQVRFTTVSRKGVLAVPVGALVAVREGGYALQTPEGGLVAVKVGVFASGLVEVSGDGVSEGLRVVSTP